MSDKHHLLIPHAFAAAPLCQAALRTLELPNLRRLLALLTPTLRDAGDEYSKSPPHERALARALGLPVEDGRIPWAAHHAALNGLDAGGEHAWGFITPCHWHVHSDHITLSDPQALRLDEPGARALLAAMQPYFSEDGIPLQYDQPGRWLARGEIFRNLDCASLDRVTGRNIDAWMPEAPQAAPLRRLQNEMQMLLYTHPANDERSARGLPPVNSFWVSGAGALDGADVPVDGNIEVAADLRAPALREDWDAWARAWRELDACACAALVQRLQSGGSATLTLCGERNAQTFEILPRGVLRRVAGMFGSKPVAATLEAL